MNKVVGYEADHHKLDGRRMAIMIDGRTCVRSRGPSSGSVRGIYLIIREVTMTVSHETRRHIAS